jgi:hypothetical protein
VRMRLRLSLFQWTQGDDVLLHVPSVYSCRASPTPKESMSRDWPWRST